MNIFGGMNILWIIYGGRCKTGLFWGHSYVFYDVFLRSSYRKGIFFFLGGGGGGGGVLKFKIFLGYACCS